MPQPKAAASEAPDTTRADAINLTVERKLSEFDVPWTRKPVTTSKANEREARKLQTRPRMIVSETVDQYALDMRKGAVFPALVVLPLTNGFAVISGNHTLAASRKAGRREVDAYQIDKNTPSEVLMLLGVALNRENGLQVPEGWRLRQAVMLLSAGLSREIVAESCGLSVHSVGNAERAQKAAARAAGLNVRRFDELPVTAQAHMLGISEDAVFTAMARTVIQYLPPPEEQGARNAAVSEKGIMETIRALRELPSEEERLKYVGTWAATLEARTDGKRRGVVRANPKANFVSAAGKLLAVNPSDLARLAVNDEERDTVMDYCERVVNHLALIEEALR